jgi:hypothetical protein
MEQEQSCAAEADGADGDFTMQRRTQMNLQLQQQWTRDGEVVKEPKQARRPRRAAKTARKAAVRK